MKQISRIRIGDVYYYLDSVDDFLELVNDLWGWDAHDGLESLLVPQDNKCTGECDYTYEIQQQFTSAIEDAIDELEGAVGKTADSIKRIQTALKILRNEV